MRHESAVSYRSLAADCIRLLTSGITDMSIVDDKTIKQQLIKNVKTTANAHFRFFFQLKTDQFKQFLSN